MKKNDIIVVDIIDMNMLGFGIAKHDDAVIFVQNAVTGDICRIKIIKEAKKYYVARIEELIHRSENRIEPKCKHYLRCGGCSFQNISYEYELEIKKKYIENELKKNHLDLKVNDVISNSRISDYRNKAQYPVSLDKNKGIICGFYSSKTHKACDIKECDIQNKIFSEITEFIVNYMKDNGISPYDELTQKGGVRHIYIRSSASDEMELTLVVRSESNKWIDKLADEIKNKFCYIRTFYININSQNTNIILGNKWIKIFGEGYIKDKILDNEYFISPASFYQVNHDMAEVLYSTAFDIAQFGKDDVVCDLYCGVGTIGLSIANRVQKLIGVEIVPEAVENAKLNAEHNEISNAEFICGDANDIFKGLDGINIDAVILDPPRKGTTKELISKISERGINKVLYISCAFDTLCRDIVYFNDLGYKASAVQPVDMFPRTSHVETVVLMSRVNR